GGGGGVGGGVRGRGALGSREGWLGAGPPALRGGRAGGAVGGPPPVEPAAAVGQPVERRGAVRAQPVVPAGRLVDAVDHADVVEEGGPQFLDGGVEPVQVRLLRPAVLRAAEDGVALVRGEEDQ